MKEESVQGLIHKLETQGDISIGEADEIYSVMNSLLDLILKYESSQDDLQDKLNQKFPLSDLQAWHEAVAEKIEAGFSGNFIFSILNVYGSPYFYNIKHPVVEALQKHGQPEDRVKLIYVNRKMYSTFPKHLQDLFILEDWEKDNKLYILNGRRAGFYRYPLRDPKSGNVYTISRIFKKMPLSPVITAQEKTLIFSKVGSTPFIMEYLKRKCPYMEIASMNHYLGEIAVFVDNESVPLVEKALDIPFEEIIKHALREKVIDEKTARKRLESDKEYLADMKFIETSVRFIDDVVKLKMEREVAKRMAEEAPECLGEIR